MTSRESLVRELAPKAPPCFASRSLWLEYLTSAAAAQKSTQLFEDARAAVLILEPGKPARFNFLFGFCMDCTQTHSFHMHNAGRCNPRHLIEQEERHADHTPAGA